MTPPSHTLSAEKLLPQATWMRGFALDLVSDPGEADDAALAVLLRPPPRAGRASWQSPSPKEP